MDHGNIVQMAPPEEMLAHPASGQIQDFLGNFIDTHAQKELTAADFMRSGVSTVSARRGVNECVSKMQRRNVDTLIVVDDQDRYHRGQRQGLLRPADLQRRPLPHRPERGGKGGRHHHQDQHDLRYGGTALGVRHIGMG